MNDHAAQLQRGGDDDDRIGGHRQQGPDLGRMVDVVDDHEDGPYGEQGADGVECRVAVGLIAFAGMLSVSSRKLPQELAGQRACAQRLTICLAGGLHETLGVERRSASTRPLPGQGGLPDARRAVQHCDLVAPGEADIEFRQLGIAADERHRPRSERS